MVDESEPSSKPVSENQKKNIFFDFISELHLGKLFLGFLIRDGKGLRDGWFGFLLLAVLVAYIGYEHGTHSSDDVIRTQNSTIANLSSIAQKDTLEIQKSNQKSIDRDAEIQKLTAERDKAQIEAENAKNAVASWMVLAQSLNTNTPLTERIDTLTRWVAMNTESLTNVFGSLKKSTNNFSLRVRLKKEIGGDFAKSDGQINAQNT